VNGRERILGRFIAEEVASALRHAQVNKIAAVGALTFHLRRQLPADRTPAAAMSVLPLIDAELSQASQALDRRFVEAPAPGEPVALRPIVEGVLASLERPQGVDLAGPGEGAACAVIDPAELDVALFCLVENAFEAVSARGTVSVSVATRDGTAVIAVTDDGPGLDAEACRRTRDPFHTSKPGHLGLGVPIALRIAQRWRGRLELEPGPRVGLVARLALPAVEP
jgi:C4-dicarboxylate-specific signal transduction histidine kinase